MNHFEIQIFLADLTFDNQPTILFRVFQVFGSSLYFSFRFYIFNVWIALAAV